MPYVSSYFRRSAGAASAPKGVLARMPSVAIYSTAGTLLRGWGQSQVTGLQFGTGLPGGFTSAEFNLPTPPKVCPIATGQKVLIRWGIHVVWWGWVEDIRRQLRGPVNSLAVACLGPYQQCVQRIMVNAIGGVDSDVALEAALSIYCDRIATDHSHITATGVDLSTQTGSYVAVADTVRAVCELGNTSSQPMLFAIWEPDDGYLDLVTPTGNLVPNSTFESNSTGWSLSAVTRTSTIAHLGSYAIICDEAAYGDWNDGTLTSSDYMAVTAGGTYYLWLSYCLKVVLGSDPAAGDNYVDTISVAWYNSSNSLLSTTTYTHNTDFPVATTSWQTIFKAMTAPASAAKAKIQVALRNYSDWNPYTFEVAGVVDDIYFYAASESGGTEAKPVPWLWARDLSTYDYLLYTGAMGANLTETTKSLANAVWADYAGGTTGQATDATSIAAYRQRDVKISASTMGQTAAEQYRNVYLDQNKDPKYELSSFTVQRGAIRTAQGAVVELPLIRAGDRLQIADGPYAGTIILLKQTAWSADGLQCTPEADLSTTQLLAKV